MAESTQVDAPSRFLRAVELTTWPAEAIANLALPVPPTPDAAPDAAPVLVLPGFMADDATTVPLRRVLSRRGYRTHAWGLGRNLGPTRFIVDGMRARLTDVFERAGRPVTLVGWSLGGVYTRLLAREQPDAVGRVITLGSPYRMRPGDESAASPLWQRLEPLHDGDIGLAYTSEEARPPLTMPATSVFTRADGVVTWTTCVDVVGPDAPNPRAENVEVFGTHTGLGFNRAVMYVILDRLANDDDQWKPFRPSWAWRWAYGCRPVSAPPEGRRAA